MNRVLFRSSSQGLTGQPRVSLEDSRANLRAMARIAREHAIVPVFLTAPSSHERGDEPSYVTRRWLWDPQQLVPLHAAYVEAVREVAAEEGALLVDLYAEFAALEQAELRRCFQEDGVHPSEEGARRLARRLYRELDRARLIEDLLE